MRVRKGVLAGTIVGLGASLFVWHAERAAVAAGANEAGLAFGDAHLLFFVSLPWSVLVWGVGVALGDRLPPGLFFAMPVAAGAGWGWVVSWVLDWRGRRARRAVTPHSVAVDR